MILKDIITKYEAFIFDMDGTLTIPNLDFDGMRSELGLSKGKPILESIEEFSTEKQQELHKKLNELELEKAKQTQAQPFVLKFIEELSQSKHLGILTRNSQLNAITTLNNIGLIKYFPENFIMSRDNCKAKPDPDGILKLCELWNIKPTQSLMIGDYLYDLQTGKNAEADTLYFDSTKQFQFKEHASYCISDFNLNSII